MYTDWCGWCKVMDRNTFTNEEVINIINNKFIPIKFDAEYQEEVFFNNNNFKINDDFRITSSLETIKYILNNNPNRNFFDSLEQI